MTRWPTILLVEDNPEHAELVRRALALRAGAGRLVHVEDGAEALDYVHGRHRFSDRGAFPRPHLVLLDLRLPRVAGLDVLREIKGSERLRDIPVVVLTTSSADPDLTAAYAAHVNSYLVKPANYDALDRLLADVRDYWLGWNRVPRA
ncbi:MAG: response regulator [Vicinamibacterales bacterium]|nr:response regulator [Vicinamibacterales bacterium]